MRAQHVRGDVARLDAAAAVAEPLAVEAQRPEEARLDRAAAVEQREERLRVPRRVDLRGTQIFNPTSMCARQFRRKLFGVASRT